MNDAKRRAIFVDRDGVVNVEQPDYVRSWKEFRFLAGAVESLVRLGGTTLPILVVTNQSAVNRGLLKRETLENIHERMVAEIEKCGGRIDGIFYCPHTPSENCDCRKPRPGLLLRASRDLGITLRGSYFVGDSAADVMAAASVGCIPILVRSKGTQDESPLDITSFPRETLFLDHLGAAADYIIGAELKGLQPDGLPS